MRTDLTYLKNMTDGDPELIREMIEIFSRQVEEYATDIWKLYKESNWLELSKLAHKAKSSLAIMGMIELSERMKELETLAKEGKEPERYGEYIDHFVSECREAVSELSAIEL